MQRPNEGTLDMTSKGTKCYLVELRGDGARGAPITIKADEVEDEVDSSGLIFRIGGKVVAKFNRQAVAGWWEDQGEYGAKTAPYRG
jgi:hypothetical protein